MLAGVMVALAIPVETATAQIRLVPDTAAYSLHDPALASGAVIWSHGRSVNSEDSRSPTPPYIEDFRRQGWDAFRLNRMRASDSLEAGSAALAHEAHRLKLAGYRRVVLAGQSFGAFISLMAADESDDVDAVIATAPAAFGAIHEPHAHYRLNASELYPLLQRLHHARVVLVYFQGDDFDPGGRGPRSQEILSEGHIPHLVIDQPPTLSTHWAASTRQFAAEFAPCITDFVSSNAIANSARCKNIPASDQIAREAAAGPHQMAPAGSHAARAAPLQGSTGRLPRQ